MALCKLGYTYRMGDGVAKDIDKAMQWYRKSADLGSALGEYQVATMYYAGEGVPQDYAKAAEWFQKAADQSELGAGESIGLMYANGYGLPKDDAKAASKMDQESQRSKNADCFYRGFHVRSKSTRHHYGQSTDQHDD